MSHRMGKPTICIKENKGSDQLRSNCEADQRLCFRYTVFFLNPKFPVSSHLLCLYRPVCVGPGWKHKLLVFSCTGSYFTCWVSEPGYEVIRIVEVLHHASDCVQVSMVIKVQLPPVVMGQSLREV